MPRFKPVWAVLTAAFLCAALIAGAPAFAKNSKSAGHGKSEAHVVWDSGKEEPSSHGKVKVFIGDKDKVVLSDYVKRHYAAHCPPGLAKKNPPCIPPGQAKKYATGAILPRDAFVPVPDDVVVRLTPPPPRGMYVRVDRNIYLIDQGTRKILDGVLLLSAVE